MSGKKTTKEVQALPVKSEFLLYQTEDGRDTHRSVPPG